MKRVAILTDEAHPQLTDDDRWLLPAFSARGVQAVPLIWSLDQFETYDAILIRSPWDYHRRFDEFINWIALRERSGTRFVNELPTLRWNLHKKYLVELGERAGEVVPTIVAPEWDWSVAKARVDTRGWPVVVIKPAISASAFETRKLDWPLSGADEAWARGLNESRALLIQPYRADVETSGELSIVAIDGDVSHVYRKRPKTGDFRVQLELGGSQERVDTDPMHQAVATRYLEAARDLSGSEFIASYARIDLLPLGEDWELGELELIEPALGFHFEPRAASSLADLVVRTIAWEE